MGHSGGEEAGEADEEAEAEERDQGSHLVVLGEMIELGGKVERKQWCLEDLKKKT